MEKPGRRATCHARQREMATSRSSTHPAHRQPWIQAQYEERDSGCEIGGRSTGSRVQNIAGGIGHMETSSTVCDLDVRCSAGLGSDTRAPSRQRQDAQVAFDRAITVRPER